MLKISQNEDFMTEEKDVLLGKTAFYESLPKTEKKIYVAHFRHPNLKRSELAKLVGCSKSSVNKFLSRPELQEEMSSIFFSRLHSPDMLEVIDKMFSLAKDDKGFKDRDKLLNLLLLPAKKKETGEIKAIIEIISKDTD